MPRDASHWHEYLLYFLDSSGTLQARHEFIAEDDAEATECAAFLVSACRDVCASGELWGGARFVTRVFANSATGGLDRFSEARQEQIIDLEEMILQSRSHLAASQRLMKSVQAARKRR